MLTVAVAVWMMTTSSTLLLQLSTSSLFDSNFNLLLSLSLVLALALTLTLALRFEDLLKSFFAEEERDLSCDKCKQPGARAKVRLIFHKITIPYTLQRTAHYYTYLQYCFYCDKILR